MATVTFLWHLHQPAYCTADGMAHAPWVALHAGGSYTTLARAIIDTNGRGQVINIVPTLIEQLDAYARGEVYDPVIEALVRPASELGSDLRDRDVLALERKRRRARRHQQVRHLRQRV